MIIPGQFYRDLVEISPGGPKAKSHVRQNLLSFLEEIHQFFIILPLKGNIGLERNYNGVKTDFGPQRCGDSGVAQWKRIRLIT